MKSSHAWDKLVCPDDWFCGIVMAEADSSHHGRHMWSPILIGVLERRSVSIIFPRNSAGGIAQRVCVCELFRHRSSTIYWLEQHLMRCEPSNERFLPEQSVQTWDMICDLITTRRMRWALV